MTPNGLVRAFNDYRLAYRSDRGRVWYWRQSVIEDGTPRPVGSYREAGATVRATFFRPPSWDRVMSS